jgi:uncharacterized protein (DUF2141 family)
MKKFATISLIGLMMNAAYAANLDVQIKGISKVQGNLMIVAYASAEDMKSGNNAWQKTMLKVSAEHETVHFEDVPPGHYGFSIFQDLDDDFKMAKNLFGMPSEPYGFSNNPVVHGRPNFDDIAFEMGSEDHSITISLE